VGEAEGWQIGALGGCPWHSERIDQRRRAITSKLDRGYEDLLDGRISDDFWARKSKAWEEAFGDGVAHLRCYAATVGILTSLWRKSTFALCASVDNLRGACQP